MQQEKCVLHVDKQSCSWVAVPFALPCLMLVRPLLVIHVCVADALQTWAV